jgi:hypothetical protein
VYSRGEWSSSLPRTLQEAVVNQITSPFNLGRPNPPTLTMRGVSGNTYAFTVYAWGTSFQPVAAAYAVLRLEPNGNYSVLYVGETEDLSSRFECHHKQGCFDRNRKTHIAARVEPSVQQRLKIEADLVLAYGPPCNG